MQRSSYGRGEVVWQGRRCARSVQPLCSLSSHLLAWGLPGCGWTRGKSQIEEGEELEELESRREKLKNLNQGGENLKKLEPRRGRGWKRRSAASTCQKVHRKGLGPPGSPLDEPINVNSGIGNIGKKGNMGQNPNLPNSQTWILT